MGDEYDLHRSRRVLFGDDVAAYEHGRPPYPARVFELLRSVGALEPGCRVVEIGPGTGVATVELLGAGAAVTAVELSDALADRLEERFGGLGLSVVRAAFEQADLPDGSFDLVASATAFHWVVPTDEGLARCADLLRPDGWLALWWNVFGDPTRADPFAEALDALLQRIEPALADRPEAGTSATSVLPYALDADARIAEIDATGRFGPVQHERIEWTGRHTVPQLRSLFASFSPWLALPEDRRAPALDALEDLAVAEFGGVVERPYVTPVYLAQRR